MKRKLILSISAVTVSGVLLFGLAKAYAQSPSPNNTYPSIVQKLVQKFGLKENDVQSVFDETQTERRAQAEARYTAWLDAEVKNGNITDAQKQLILQKRQELLSQQQALSDWAKNNNISPRYLMGGHMGPFGGMHGGWHFK